MLGIGWCIRSQFQHLKRSSPVPLSRGPPPHTRNPGLVGEDLNEPYVGPLAQTVPPAVVPVYGACRVTPQEAPIAGKDDVEFTHYPGARLRALPRGVQPDSGVMPQAESRELQRARFSGSDKCTGGHGPPNPRHLPDARRPCSCHLP